MTMLLMSFWVATVSVYFQVEAIELILHFNPQKPEKQRLKWSIQQRKSPQQRWTVQQASLW